jgi:two-component system CheB/CheR fusion protein
MTPRDEHGSDGGDAVLVVRRELDAAYQQLQATNEALATANDELRATIAELENTNRELVSANEELEALTRELHATNDDIAAISDELRRRSDEVDDVNAYLTAVLDALGHAVIVVDTELKVRTWNRQAQRRWGSTRQDVLRRSLLGLDLGLPMDELTDPLRSLLDGNDDEPVFEVAPADGVGPCAVRLAAVRPNPDQVAGVMLVVSAPASAPAGRRGGAR